MPNPPHSNIIFILGPTAGGKSDLALDYARYLKESHSKTALIINCDAMQLYQPLSIITARPTQAQTQQTPHELYGILPALHQASAAWWREQALSVIEDNRHQHKIIIVGGTGLYAKSLLEGLSPIPDIPPTYRTQAQAKLHEIGHAPFHEYLASFDPQSAQKIRPSDTQRLIRAVEIFLATGKNLSHFQAMPKIPAPAYLSFKCFIASPPRALLHERINLRVYKMIEAGAIDEIRHIMDYDANLPMMKAIGITELTEHLRGKSTLDQAIAKIQAATRSYAKRQVTWCRHQITAPIWLDSENAADNLARLIALDAGVK